MSDGNKRKIKLGKKTDSGYIYSTKVDFSEDLSVQIGRLLEEKKAKDTLEEYIDGIKSAVSNFKQSKEKNLDYYYDIGETLSFIESKKFRSISPFSILRRIADEVKDILPRIDRKRVVDHLMMMYRIGKLNKNLLKNARWDQWYEITKFNRPLSSKQLKQIFIISKQGATAKTLRQKVKKILEIKNDR